MTLSCEHIPYSHLVEEFGTLLYVYSKSALIEALDSYQIAFTALNPLVCYAAKANGDLSIIKHLASSGSGFDIVSGGESACALTAGGDAAKTISFDVGRNEAEIESALNTGVKCFNIESIPEIDRTQKVTVRLGKVIPVSLRVNPDVDTKTHPYTFIGLKANKFGTVYADALEAYRHAPSQSHLKIVGIDCHIGSQLTDLSPLIEACERILALIDQLVEEGIVLEHLNLGGGTGIAYQDENVPDLGSYAQAVQKLIGTRHLKLILEPGHSLVGNAGALLTRIEFVKHGEEKNFVTVDAAMNNLMRPVLYDAYHHIETVETKDIEPLTANIVGPVCETGDFLGKGRTTACEEGNLLLIRSTGAHDPSMASSYNTRNRAAEVLIDGSGYKLIRQRETAEQQMANELACL